MATVRKALLMSFAERYGTTGLHFISVIILARILTPEDIGIYTIGVAVIAFAHMLRDFGVPNYVIQEKELTIKKVGTAFGMALLIGWSLALLLVVFAEDVATYYNEEGVRDILYVMSCNFVLIPLGAMAPALLRRKMEFSSLFKIRITAAAANVSTSIGLGLLDFGYMCMAWGSLVGIATSTMLCLVFLPNEYRTWPTLSAWKTVFRFSSFNTMTLALQELGTSGTDLIVGKVSGFSTLGLLSRANGYVDIFRRLALGAITPVMHALLAQKHRGGKDMSASYISVFTYLIGLGLPSYLFLLVMSEEIILLLYGERWVGASSAASILCLLGILKLPGVINDQILLSMGMVKRQFQINVVTQPVKLMLVVLFATQGLETIAWILVLSEIVQLSITQLYVTRLITMNLRALILPLLKGSVISLLSVAGPVVISHYYLVDSANTLLVVMFSFALGAIGWGAGVALTDHPLKSELFDLFQRLRGEYKRRFRTK